MSHGLVGQRGDQPAMGEATRIGVRLGETKAQNDRIRCLPGVDRLPRIGQRTGPGLPFETVGDIEVAHATISRRKMPFVIERDRGANCTAYKV